MTSSNPYGTLSSVIVNKVKGLGQELATEATDAILSNIGTAVSKEVLSDLSSAIPLIGSALQVAIANGGTAVPGASEWYVRCSDNLIGAPYSSPLLPCELTGPSPGMPRYGAGGSLVRSYAPDEIDYIGTDNPGLYPLEQLLAAYEISDDMGLSRMVDKAPEWKDSDTRPSPVPAKLAAYLKDIRGYIASRYQKPGGGFEAWASYADSLILATSFMPYFYSVPMALVVEKRVKGVRDGRWDRDWKENTSKVNAFTGLKMRPRAIGSEAAYFLESGFGGRDWGFPSCVGTSPAAANLLYAILDEYVKHVNYLLATQSEASRLAVDMAIVVAKSFDVRTMSVKPLVSL